MEKEVREIYNRIAKRYHKLSANHFFNAYLEVPATTFLLKDVKGKKVLDLGCGTGRHTIILKKRGAKVWGLDLSPKMLEIAKSEIKGVDFKVGTVYNLPYKSNFFDIVMSGLVVGYFEDIDKAFKEIHRVLKKNGIFVFSITNPLLEISKHIKGRPHTFRKFGNYFKEGRTYAHWPTFMANVLYYHRTLQSLVRAIVKNKFFIEDIVEAKPVKEGKKINPSFYSSYSKIPYFIVFKVRKVIE
jgi:ubiquinone/menaquinone biosynthesis C-methylase UbiE